MGVFVTVLLTLATETPAFAQAQQFGDRGQLVITAENLMGISVERIGWDVANNTETSTTNNRFGLLYSRSTGSLRAPWIGGHYFVIPNLSIGATIGFETQGGSQTSTQGGTTVTTDRDNSSAFVFLPKVGYALMFNNMVGFWFRGGPGVAHYGTSNPNTSRSDAWNFWFLSLDALLVVTPVQYFAFYAGPQLNLSFTGSYSQTNNNGSTVSWDASYRSFSIDAGIIGYFNL